MIPENGLARLQAWVDVQHVSMPAHVREQIRYELAITDRTVTIIEARPPWREDIGPDWTRHPVARLRYWKERQEWSLYWRDRNGDFHEYDLVPPSRDVGDLIAEIEADPTAIFWG